MSLQCRAGAVRLGARVTTAGLPSCLGATSLGSDVAEISAAYEPPADKAEELARDLWRNVNITLNVWLGSGTYVVCLGPCPGRVGAAWLPLHNAAARVVPSDVNERVLVLVLVFGLLLILV